MFASLGITSTVDTPSGRQDGEGELLASLRRKVDERLGLLLADPEGGGNRIAAAMRYGTLAPGKRVRPLLLLLAARGLGVEPHRMLDAACALEMVHAASLFLDDMPCMDDADLRRGQPTVHVAFGEDVAMLGAVALLACAWRTTARMADIAPGIRAEMVAALSEAVGLDGLVTGQYRDLHGNPDATTAGQAERTNHQKTGALFAVAFELAGLAAGSNPRVRDCMRQAAVELGQAFQLADDLDDGEMDTFSLGKDCRQDVGKATLVALIGATAARGKLDAHIEQAERLLSQAMPADKALIRMTRTIFDRTAARKNWAAG